MGSTFSFQDNHEGPEGGNEDDEEEDTFDYDAAFLVEDMMPDQEGTPETEEEADSFGEFTDSLNGDQDLLSSAIFKSVSGKKGQAPRYAVPLKAF